MRLVLGFCAEPVDNVFSTQETPWRTEAARIPDDQSRPRADGSVSCSSDPAPAPERDELVPSKRSRAV